MKAVTVLASTMSLIGAVMAQGSVDDLPSCGQVCINNLVGSSSDFGCNSGDSEANCLCSNANFTYGIRDCANESCPDQSAASSVIAYGISYCSSAGVAIPTTIATVTSGTIVPSVTGTASGSGATGGASVTTSSFLTTITSGSSIITTSEATTITGTGGVGNSISSAASSALSSASSAASSAVSSIGSSASNAASSVASGAASSASASGFAPQVTAHPAGFLAAAGLAVMML